MDGTASNGGKSAKRPGLFSRFSYLLGDLRGLFLPFGLFALVAVGVHIGSDRLDDQLFVLFNIVDGWLDEVAAFFIREVSSWFEASKSTVDMLSFRAADLIDLELKGSAARVSALALELGADLILALPVFLYRSGNVPSPREVWASLKKTFMDPTVLKVVGPAAAIGAVVAGAFAVSREIQVLTHSLVSETGLRVDLASFVASTAGFLALSVIAWRLGALALIGAVTYADRIARNDRAMTTPARKRVMRGLITAVVALPIAVLAIDATPIVGTIRALLWM